MQKTPKKKREHMREKYEEKNPTLNGLFDSLG